MAMRARFRHGNIIDIIPISSHLVIRHLMKLA